MLENILTALIVLICAFFIGRRFYKQFTGKSSGCSCSCTGCDSGDEKKDSCEVTDFPSEKK